VPEIQAAVQKFFHAESFLPPMGIDKRIFGYIKFLSGIS